MNYLPTRDSSGQYSTFSCYIPQKIFGGLMVSQHTHHKNGKMVSSGRASVYYMQPFKTEQPLYRTLLGPCMAVVHVPIPSPGLGFGSG